MLALVPFICGGKGRNSNLPSLDAGLDEYVMATSGANVPHDPIKLVKHLEVGC